MQTAFYQNRIELIESIEDCYAKHRFISCLILLYSGIDAMASLDAGGRAAGPAFRHWVNQYLLKANPLPCTALELWGARCGVVHTFTAQSDLSRHKKVRMVVYAWGNYNAEDLTEAAQLMQQPYVGISLRELIDAFRRGLVAFEDDLSHYPERLRKAEVATGTWFIRVNDDRIQKLLQYAHATGVTLP